MKVPDTYTDDQLICLIREDNVAAFEQLYNRYWEKLFDSAYSRLRQKEACEECLQEVFVTLWEKRCSLEITTGLRQYLFTAVKYKVIDYYRKLHIRNSHLSVVAGNAGAGADNSVEEIVLLNDLKAYLEKAVMLLPDKCRSVYQLSRLEHKSNREIALLMNMSEKTVEGHLTKALRVLRLAARNFVIVAFIHFS